MADHIHDLPVCESDPDDIQHEPSCVGQGRMIACEEIVNPEDPNFGKALCRHVDEEAGN